MACNFHTQKVLAHVISDHVLIEASGRAMLKRGAGVQRASRGASWNALLDGNAPVLALQLQVL
eukprot:scaffold131364_cov17-Tisochrysis_lutea.AAC.1